MLPTLEGSSFIVIAGDVVGVRTLRAERPAHEPRLRRSEGGRFEDRVGAGAPSPSLGGRFGLPPGWRLGDRPDSTCLRTPSSSRLGELASRWPVLILTRFRRHPGWRENAPGVVDGTKETKVVHARVQGRGGAPGAGRGPQRPRGGEGPGPDGDCATGVGQGCGDRRRQGPAGRADDGGARGAGAASAGEQAAGDGARDLEKSGGLLREGEQVRFALIDAEKAHYPIAVLCAALEVS